MSEETSRILTMCKVTWLLQKIIGVCLHCRRIYCRR